VRFAVIIAPSKVAVKPVFSAEVTGLVVIVNVAERLPDLPLLQLVAAEDDDPPRVQVGQRVPYEAPAERPGTSGDQDVGAGKD